MITSTLKHSDRYNDLNPAFPAAFAFLKRHLEQPFPEGRHEIADGIYAVISHYETQDPDMLNWEGHREYLDIQFVSYGSEILGYADISGMTQITEYDREQDIQLFDGDGQSLILSPGVFAVLYPEDIHKPKGIFHERCGVEKIVIKVKL